jgi:hypothetical protein
MVQNCFLATSFLFTPAEDNTCSRGAFQRAQESYLYTMASSPRARGTSRPYASTSHTSRPKTSTRRTPRNQPGIHKLLRWQLLLAADRVDLVGHGIDAHVCGIEEENTRHRGLPHREQPALTRKNVRPRVSTRCKPTARASNSDTWPRLKSINELDCVFTTSGTLWCNREYLIHKRSHVHAWTITHSQSRSHAVVLSASYVQ